MGDPRGGARDAAPHGDLFVRHGIIGQLNASLRSGKVWGEAFKDAAGAGIHGGRAFLTGEQAYATADTLMTEYFPRRLNDGLASAGLGLPAGDMGSGFDMYKGLFLRRILPMWGAYEGYRYADYKLGGTGLAPSELYANLRSQAGLTRARLTGDRILGIRRELLPGLDKFLPDRNEEEEREHQDHGLEPVRKGRFWAIASRGEFWGERVSWWAPSAVRVARSHWQEADNVDLSGRDFWRHHPLPTLENPLGPLGTLLSGREEKDWWERKHAHDRPYPVTSELSDPDTLHGPWINATVGALFKPKRVLAPEYLPKSLGGSASKAELQAINEAIKRGDDRPALQQLVGPGGPATGYGKNGRGGESFWGSPGVLPLAGETGPGGGPGKGSGRGASGKLAVMTPAGQLQAMVPGASMSGGDWDQLGNSSIQRDGWATRLSRREVERANSAMKQGFGGGGKSRPGGAAARLAMSKTPWDREDLDLVDYQSGVISGARGLVDLGGLYGYLLEATTGEVKQKGLIVPSAAYARGPNRRFYEAELGGLGGELSEVGRRFMARRQRREEFNPLPNDAAAWLPGPEYMVDFHHGDQFSKVQRGELRLPGDAYERTHDVTLMQSRASSLGKSEAELMRQMLFLEEPLSQYGEQVTEKGNEIHKALQRRWKRMGILLGAEFQLQDKEEGISGHPDAILAMADGPALTDIKTVSGKRFREAQRRPFDEHVSQVRWYLGQLKDGMPDGGPAVKRGFITYVNRDDPTQIAFHDVRFSQSGYDRDVRKVQRARERLLGLVDQHVISRGDLYSPIERFSILGDVAPYSENYAQLREYLTTKHEAGDLSEADNERFQAIKKRVAQQKRRVDTYDYHFKNVQVERKSLVVDQIIDANTFTVKGQENPIRLAGVRSSATRAEALYGDAPEGMTAAEWQWKQFGITPGSRVQVDVDADPRKQIARDTYRTMHGVVYAGGKNVNQELIQNGVGEEKEGDWTSPGVKARFSDREIQIGSMWERFAHMDTIFHNKFLRVRSPLEELERGIVYGKHSGSWNHPVRDFILPTLESAIAQPPLAAAALAGGFAGYFFGKEGMRLKATAIGAAAGAALSLGRMAYEHASGETWKPARTRKREEIEAYFDTLQYVKYRGLAAKEEQLAREKEGVSVERMVKEVYAEGQQREKRRRWLEGIKRDVKLGRKDESDIPKDHEGNPLDLNAEIERLSQPQGMLKLGPHTARALQYREKFRSTLYGIDPQNSPFVNLLHEQWRVLLVPCPVYQGTLIYGGTVHVFQWPTCRRWLESTAMARSVRLMPDHSIRS